MEENKTVQEKMTYEQLEQVAHQLSEQSRELYMQLQKKTLDNVFQRLNYLFKVLDSAVYFDTEFVQKCSDEIKDLLTIPEQKEEQETKQEEVTE